MKQACLLALALAGCPMVALAQGPFGYTYVEAYHQGYASSDLDGTGIGASVELGERWFVFGGYTLETDGYGDSSTYGRQVENARFFDAERRYKRIGLGFHHPVGSRTDLVARAMFDRSDSTIQFQYWDDAGDNPANDIHAGSVSYRYDVAIDSWQAEAGVRGLLASHWEAWGVVGYSYASSPKASSIEVIDLTNRLCIAGHPTNCKLAPADLRAAIERNGNAGRPYARLGTHLRLTDRWGLSAEGKFTPGGGVSYFAGVRFTF